MPYLQLDTPFACSPDVRRRLAQRFGDLYAEHMAADRARVTVAVRVEPDGIWRCGDGEPRPAALLMCDIRRGRSAERRARLAEALLAACDDILGLHRDQVNIEFTAHAGEDMYHPMRGGFSDDWAPEDGA